MTIPRVPAAPDVVDALRALSATPAARQTLRETYGDAPPEVLQWLGRALLLEGVPFETLIPSSELLPLESARFFFVDVNWLHSLVDGALSVGTHSSKSGMFYDVVRATVAHATRAAAAGERAARRGKTPAVADSPDPPPPPKPWTGLLIRSAVVSGWPGLQVRPYADAAGTTALTLLRMDRLSPDVLLCLFEGVPLRVDVQEPMEGIAFGGEEDTRVLVLRGLGLHNVGAGAALRTTCVNWTNDRCTRKGAGGAVDCHCVVQAVLRPLVGGKASRVLDVGGTLSTVQQRLSEFRSPTSQTPGAWVTGDPFGAGSFGLQLLKAPEQQEFSGGGS